MSRRILAACAVPVLALPLRSAPALAQGVAVSVALPDLGRLPEAAPLPAIAESHHVSVASLCRANALPADCALRPGMYLRIPS